MPKAEQRTKILALVAAGAIAIAAYGVAWAAFAATPDNPLIAPAITSPTNGTSIGTDQFTMADWGDVLGSSTPITYQFESSLGTTTNSDGGFASSTYMSGTLSNSSIDTIGTPAGTYFWHVRAMDSMGSTSPWSLTTQVIVTPSTTTSTSTATTTPSTDIQTLITHLQGLIVMFPQFGTWIQNLIDQLNMGTTTPPVIPPTQGSATISNNGQSVRAGGVLDFNGRNFGHEETVTIMRNGLTIGSAHADGGGNFTTGSMTVPSTPGSYTYSFHGGTSGMTANAVITVTP